ncbi:MULTISPECIES: VanZ family protein [unclassified Streptococcus]|uniref:VanZ family protein n=1 Tax=unclassified Streptococcus TaxID=2608887 RepID=UPI0010720545|nr:MULTISPECIES: VanZ family protein [unclassified Streptococcus]MBF0788111.1 VanZ family protein [Streptococcus sp. 19428wC2_LYSM12]MCQ9212076.1 VanZ family protein [Streptococcus sp. B01]MCQ9213405.1 VanZ family protein [Streptococcus sp. O1]TFV04826.1 VanZ family protein [Streptococcus sp. LYSM12]
MKYLFQRNGELTQLGRRIVLVLVWLYVLAICCICFLPQSIYPQYKMFSTPGIVQIGRFYLLLVPFNSVVNAHKLDSLVDWWMILLQNLTNIFLLYPLVLAFVFLFRKWQNFRVVIRYSFLISLFIECSQLLLDFLFDVGRIFEVDDLWTNTLGGLLAYFTYRLWKKTFAKNERILNQKRGW